jgi:phage gp36-like protein
MAPYVTADEMHQLTVAGERFASVSIPLQDVMLESVSRFADSYLRSRTAVPVAAPGADLKLAVAHIAAWRILSRRGMNPADKGAEALKELHDASIEWLKGVSESDVTPGGIDTGGTGSDSGRQYVVVARVDSCGVTHIEPPQLRGW